MFGLGPAEFVVILLLAILFIGPDKIPRMATTLGQWIRRIRVFMKDIRSQIEKEETLGRHLIDLQTAWQGNTDADLKLVGFKKVDGQVSSVEEKEQIEKKSSIKKEEQSIHHSKENSSTHGVKEQSEQFKMDEKGAV